MEPVQPPLPLASYFPFQLAAVGSQISILMSESVVGRRVADTRQKAGRLARAALPRALEVASPPAGISMAEVMAPPGSLREVRLSQVEAWVRTGVRRSARAQTGSDAFIASEYIRCQLSSLRA